VPIAELGYRSWQGVRTGALVRALAIARSEVAIALQASKLLRRFLILAWIPILYFCPFFLAIGYVANPENDPASGVLLTGLAREFLGQAAIDRLRQDPGAILPGIWAVAFYVFFAYTQSFLSMIAVAIAGPPLIAKDLRNRAFLVYFSKPIQPWQYLLGKLGTVAAFVFSMTLLPALVLYAVGIALSPDLGGLLATFPIVFEIAAASVAIAIPIAVVVLVLSSLTADRRIATFGWLAVWIFGEIAFRALTVSGGQPGHQAPPWAALLSLRELTTRAASGIFDARGRLELLLQQFGESGGRLRRTMRDIAEGMGDPHVLDRPRDQVQLLDLAGSGYPPIVSIAVLAAIAAAGILFLLRRVVRPVQV